MSVSDPDGLQTTGSLYVRRTAVENSGVVVAIDGLSVSTAAVPDTVSAAGRTMPARLWILLAPPAEQPRLSVTRQVTVALTRSPLASGVAMPRLIAVNI